MLEERVVGCGACNGHTVTASDYPLTGQINIYRKYSKIGLKKSFLF